MAQRNKQLSRGHAVYTLDNKEIGVDNSDKAKKVAGWRAKCLVAFNASPL